MRERRECREPHTFLDSCGLEMHTSPRLNELRHQGTSSGNPEATTSTVFNRFSSVSPHQAGISYNSTFDDNHNGINAGINSGFIPPPPPFFFPGDTSGTLQRVEWPPSIPAPPWTLPQNLPWIPPPPISLNTSGVAHGNINDNSATAKWPTPQDIPLPSTFPFPPCLLSPFPPLPPNADLSQLPPPPPPWFGVPTGYMQPQQPQQQHEKGQYEDNNTSSTVDDEGAKEPVPRRGKEGALLYSKGCARQPSISAREEHHMRSIARNARRQLHHKLSRSSSMDSSRNSVDKWHQTLRTASPRQRRGVTRETPTSARRFSPPCVTRRVKMATPSLGRSAHQSQRRDYYTAARALKGVSPRLEDVMDRRPSTRRVQSGSASCNKNYNGNHRHTSTVKKNNNNHSFQIDELGASQHVLNQKHATRDERVAEYLKGIEDLYQRLRNSYEDFQRDPSSFLKNISTLKKTAAAKTPPLTPFSNNILDDTNLIKKKKQDATEHGAPHTVGFPLLSDESQRIREELLKLEMQWQRLEELKRGSTGERGAGPVEITSENTKWLPSQRKSSVNFGKSDVREGGSSGHRVNGDVVPVSDSTRGSNMHRGLSSAVGAANDNRTNGGLSRSSTPPMMGDQPMAGGHLNKSQVDKRSSSVNGTNSHAAFTREHVLGLVRERKAMLE